MKYIRKIPLPTLVFACMTLGLAPFAPPHIYDKLIMLFNGTLIKAVDWFDFLFHGTPWLLLDLKLIDMYLEHREKSKEHS